MLVAFVVGLVLGFAAGFLVYRKNGKNIEADAIKAKADAEAAYEEYKSALAKLRKG